MRDAEVEVIDGIGDKERRAPVAAPDHEVLDRSIREFDTASHDVIEDRHAVVGNSEPHCPVVGVCASLVEPAVDCCVIEGTALALVDRLAVKIQAQPFEHFQDLIDVARGGKLRVGVLDAQKHLPIAVTGIQPVEQGRAGSAQVRQPGGRRSETQSRASGLGRLRRRRTHRRHGEARSCGCRSCSWSSRAVPLSTGRCCNSDLHFPSIQRSRPSGLLACPPSRAVAAAGASTDRRRARRAPARR